MRHDDARQFVLELYDRLLKRTPQDAEWEHWVGVLAGGQSAEAVFRAFIHCREYQDRTRVHPAFPDGHFHSPVVDPATVADYVRERRDPPATAFAGVAVPA